jgi:mannose-6-phosphate isomerase
MSIYRTDAPEFELSRIEWAAGDDGEVSVHCTGPQILLCTAGEVFVTADDGERLELGRGQSVWLPAADPAVRLRPTGTGRVQVFGATAGSSVDAPC